MHGGPVINAPAAAGSRQQAADKQATTNEKERTTFALIKHHELELTGFSLWCKLISDRGSIGRLL